MRGGFRRIMALLLSLSMVISLVGCSTSDKNPDNSNTNPTETDTVIMNDVEINDSLVTLEVKGLEVNNLTIEDINVDEILANCITVKGIDSIEIEVVSVNDEFVYLAYENFVSVYGEDFDLSKFLIDVGIAGGCILICVTLSVAGGPVGTFFGAIITSQFTTSAVLIGTAIDAAVSAYMAYEEGGDVSYILGHMLNGVADGMKWSAILAPLSGAVDGIKALRAVKELRKIPGLEDVTDKEARKIFELLPDIIDKAGKTSDSITDDALKTLYKQLPEEITAELSEDVLKSVLKNSTKLSSITTKFNPFNLSKKVTKAMQGDFLKRAKLSEDAGKKLIKEIQNGTIKNLDDISDAAARKFIKENLYEFAQYFGGSFSKDFIDSCLKHSLGDNAFDLVKKSINSDDLYLQLVKTLGRETADKVLSDSNTLILLQLRYGTKNVNKLVNVHLLYNQMLRDNKIDDKQLEEVFEGIINGKFKNLGDVANVNKQIAKNLTYSREVTAQAIKNLGKDKAVAGLLDDIASDGLKYVGISQDCAKDIISNSLSKTDIISKYGDDVYKSLMKDSNYNLCINCLATRSEVNSSLIKDLTSDMLKNNDLSDDLIKKIMSGNRITEWGLADDKIMDISNIVADYYRVTDASVYSNYVKELAEKRGEYISEFLAKYADEGNTITNIKYAGGVMEPHLKSNPEYIKAKYGDIYMNTYGFPIFDEHAIARIEMTNLVGDDGIDIANANLLHHGTQASLPGYTWHHLEDGKTLILIPTDLHEAYKHTGGAALIREGLGG